MHIVIISGSVRTGRASHRVALFFKNYIEQNKLGTVFIADLAAYNFPVFQERLKFQERPLPAALEFAQTIKSADGVIIVTPEYNGGYPAAVKNAVDLLVEEWKRKPVAICTVSAGAFGGTQVITSLQFSLWKIGAIVIPAMFPVPEIDKTYDENGIPSNKEGAEKRAARFLAELKWFIDAKQKMNG
jgi:NAD(P)H-dependent FMN reductase